MFGGTLTECICAVVSGVLLLIALPNMIAKKMHAGTWCAFFAALALDAYIALAEHFSNNLIVDWFGIILLIGIAAALFVVFVLSLFLIFGFRRANKKNCTGDETVIVLGARIYRDHLSNMLVGRLEAAERILNTYPQMKCIVSGGKGHDEPRSEAEAMKGWLVEHGIAADRILCEDHSTDTAENFRFSAAVLDREGLSRSVIIATDFYHQYRASLLAKRAGLSSCGVSGFKEPLMIPGYWLREIIGLLYFYLFRRT